MNAYKKLGFKIIDESIDEKLKEYYKMALDVHK
jgi:hypothetical protein